MERAADLEDLLTPLHAWERDAFTVGFFFRLTIEGWKTAFKTVIFTEVVSYSAWLAFCDHIDLDLPPLKAILHFLQLCWYIEDSGYINVCCNAIARNGADEDHFFNMTLFGIPTMSYLSAVCAWYLRSQILGILWPWMPSLCFITCVLTLAICLLSVVELISTEHLAFGTLHFIKMGFFGGLQIIMFLHGISYSLARVSAKAFNKLQNRLVHAERPAYWGQPYVFGKLNANNEIRLLKISRSRPFADFDCRLIKASLTNLPDYEAISYTWGNQLQDRDLMVDGRILRVSQVVIDIIRERASFIAPKLLWIDGVCINQEDLTEKAAQVERMRDIYAKANRTIVWLGYAPGAFQCMLYLVDLHRRFRIRKSDREWKSILGIGSHDRRFALLFALWEHPYWTRAWIVQEIAVSQSVILSYGGMYLDWTILEGIVFGLLARARSDSPIAITSHDVMVDPFMEHQGMVQLQILAGMRKTFHDEKFKVELGELVGFSSTFKTTDPRDRIYALLGLVKSTHHMALKPDYTISMAELNIIWTRVVLRRQPLWVLPVAGIGWAHQEPAQPSWVPDVTKSWVMAATSRSNVFPVDVCHCASGSNREPFRELHQTLPILIVQLLTFDSILALGPEFFYPDQQTDRSEELLRLARSSLAYDNFAQAQLKQGRYLHTTQTRTEAIWRARIGDRVIKLIPMQRPAPAEYGTYYTKHLERMSSVVDALEGHPFEDDNEHPLYSAEFTDPLSDLTKWEHCWAQASVSNCQGRRVAITRNGALAMVPVRTQVGDVVGLMQGLESCVVMRAESRGFSMAKLDTNVTVGTLIQSGQDSSTQNAGRTNEAATNPDKTVWAPWRFVGECYVHGFMDGEALNLGKFAKVNVW